MALRSKEFRKAVHRYQHVRDKYVHLTKSVQALNQVVPEEVAARQNRLTFEKLGSRVPMPQSLNDMLEQGFSEAQKLLQLKNYIEAVAMFSSYNRLFAQGESGVIFHVSELARMREQVESLSRSNNAPISAEAQASMKAFASGKLLQGFPKGASGKERLNLTADQAAWATKVSAEANVLRNELSRLEQTAQAEQRRRAEERRRQEETRIAEERRAEQQRRQAEADAAAERRRQDEARIADERRRLEESRAADQRRRDAEFQRMQEERRAQEEARQRQAEERRAAMERQKQQQCSQLQNQQIALLAKMAVCTAAMSRCRGDFGCMQRANQCSSETQNETNMVQRQSMQMGC